MNRERPTPPPLTEAEEREWLAQERAWREERDGAAASDDPALAAYREVTRALRTPQADGLPRGFAATMAARCDPAAASTGVDTRFEQHVQRLLLIALAVAATAACAVYGSQWLRATIAALPLLASATALNWATALGACLALSWSLDVLRRRTPAR